MASLAEVIRISPDHLDRVRGGILFLVDALERCGSAPPTRADLFNVIVRATSRGDDLFGLAAALGIQPRPADVFIILSDLIYRQQVQDSFDGLHIPEDIKKAISLDSEKLRAADQLVAEAIG